MLSKGLSRVFSNTTVQEHQGPFTSGGQSIGVFSFSVSPSNEYSELISFRIEWFHLLAVQGTLKSLLQHHSSKTSALQCSAFFMVQLSHAYMTTGKTITLTRQTFVTKQCFCFLIHCLGFSQLFFQGANVFQFHGCSHHLQ